MITFKRINIPIFDYKLTIVIFDDWKELKERLPDYDLDEEARAITLSQYDDYKGGNKVYKYFREA